jgi:molybdopterin-guanine dinucleotide biosynthesis protein A
MRVTGIVLAGGRSSRMGQDKAALVLDGRTLLQHACDALAAAADEIVIVGSPGRPLPAVSAAVPVRRVDDAVEGEGPLAGIAAGLAAAHGEVAAVVGCDMPHLAPALLRLLAEQALAGARLVVPLHHGRPEGLCSAWRVDALPVVQAHLAAGDRAVLSVEGDLDGVRLAPEAYRDADPEGLSFVNMNTPEELRAEIEAREASRG